MGDWNCFVDWLMKNWVKELVEIVSFVVVVGDCVIYGGILVMVLNFSEFEGL